MSVPTFTSITPSTGPAGGKLLVEIVGTNFKLYAAPPTTGPVPVKAYAPVAVLFGTKPSPHVAVWTGSRIVCEVPAGVPGVADVTVTNQNEDTGVAVVGESVTAHAAFTYALPKLRADSGAANDSDLTRTVRALLHLLQQQVLAEAILTTNTDWSATPDALNTVLPGKFPALVLAGPDLAENKFFRTSERPRIDNGSNQFTTRRSPRTIDLQFRLLGASDTQAELLNLLAAVEQFRQRNPYFFLDRDPADSTKGQVRYDLEYPSDFTVPQMPNTSNVRSFSGALTLVGFDIEGLVEYGAADMTVDRALTADDTQPTMDPATHT